MTNAILRGKPDAGNPHVRFDEGEVASEKPRRGSLLYKEFNRFAIGCLLALGATFGLRAETIAYWPFGTNGLNDVSGNGHTLVKTGTFDETAGAPVLTAGSSFATAEKLDLSPHKKITVEFFWKRMNSVNDRGVVFGHTNLLSGSITFSNTPNGLVGPQMKGGAQCIDKATSQPALTQWLHHACVFDISDGVRIEWFINGTCVKGVTNSNVIASFPNDTLFLGKGMWYYVDSGWHSGEDASGAGEYADLRISSGELSPDQFLKFPTIGRTMMPDSPTFAQWSFGTALTNDVSGNGLTGMGGPNVRSGAVRGTGYSAGPFTTPSLPLQPFGTTKAGLTVEGWFRPTSVGSSGGTLFINSKTSLQPNQSGGMTAGINTSGQVWSNFRVNSKTDATGYNKDIVTSLPSVLDSRWHHVAVVVDPKLGAADSVKLYVDGVLGETLDGYENAASTIAAQQFFVGNGVDNSSYNGQISQFRVTAGALTPKDFVRSPTKLTKSAYWDFTSATPLKDISGFGNDLAASGVTFDGEGAVFNGLGSLVTAVNLCLANTRWVTVECRFKADADCSGLIFGTPAMATYGAFAAKLESGVLTSALRNKTTGDALQTRTASDVGTGWHHLALRLDLSNRNNNYMTLGRNFQMYLDGVLCSTGASNLDGAVGFFPDGLLCIGGGSDYTSGNFKGKIAELAITPDILEPDDFALAANETAKGTLIAYWPFKGDFFRDASGNGHVLEGTATANDNAAYFDGSISTLNTQSALDLSGTRTATVECLFKFDGDGQGCFFSEEGREDAGTFATYVEGGKAVSFFRPFTNGTNRAEIAIASCRNGKWHHLALVVEAHDRGADTTRMYVDGVLADATRFGSVQTFLPVKRFFIGCDGDATAGTGAFKGWIDDVRITAGALEPSEFFKVSERTKAKGLVLLFR